MATNTSATQTRDERMPLVHYLHKTINFNDTDISTGRPFARYIPALASIQWVMVKIKTAFNAATTNVLTVGQNATSYNDMVAAADVLEGSTGSYMVLRGADLTLSADTLPFVKYTQSGTAATAGVAEIVIAYTVNVNDQ
jgi:hypothetical protein